MIAPPVLALRTLLDGTVDYAGLFPPAALAMEPAVRAFAEYARSADAWALGRFVVPVGRLAELESAAAGLAPRRPDAPWRLSALVGGDVAGELRALGEFNCRHAADGAEALSADTVEIRTPTVEAVDAAAALLPRYLQAYLEIPVAADPAPLVAAVARAGARAKVRTGGITPDLFPTSTELVRFMRACVSAGVAFKATAGLHHPLRAEYRLTYEPDAPSGTMYGFLNVFLAAALLHAGADDATAARMLEERSPGSVRFDADGVSWAEYRLDLEQLARAHRSTAISFGSCSFREPLDDLHSLGFL
jgi:hypothetical protein